jgi:hypothetical protein
MTHPELVLATVQQNSRAPKDALTQNRAPQPDVDRQKRPREDLLITTRFQEAATVSSFQVRPRPAASPARAGPGGSNGRHSSSVRKK